MRMSAVQGEMEFSDKRKGRHHVATLQMTIASTKAPTQVHWDGGLLIPAQVQDTGPGGGRQPIRIVIF